MRKKTKKFKNIITEKDTRPRSGHVNLSGMGAWKLKTESRQDHKEQARKARLGFIDTDLAIFA